MLALFKLVMVGVRAARTEELVTNVRATLIAILTTDVIIVLLAACRVTQEANVISARKAIISILMVLLVLHVQ